MLPRSASIPSPTHALSQPAHPQQVPPPPFYPDQRSFEPLEYGHRHPSHFHGHPYLQHPGQPMDILADYRTFFPYQPNEVKHRRRTTAVQLKVLEGIFKTETKPNAALRNKLAVQLEMTARGVQVWFQNRRAKEKLKASKASKAKEEKSNADKADASPPSPSNPPTGGSSSSTTTPAAEESKSDQSAATTPPTTPPSKPDSPPDSSAISPPALTINVAPSEPPSLQSPWQAPASGGSPAQHTLPVAPVPSVDDAALLAQRRGSLPAHLYSTVDPSSDLLSVHHDQFARRRSVDASLQRLPYNPYAPVARARNGMHSGLNPHRGPAQRGLCPPMARAISMDARRFSVDVVPSAQRMYSRPSPQLPYSRPSLPNGSLTSLPNGSRPSLPNGTMYAYTQRPVPPSPIPGPLPAPNFSFGAPMPPAESEQDSPRREDFDGHPRDFDGQSLASSYAASSRFGSLASISTTDSQHTYYSDVTDPADYALRRASMTSNQFLGMMSNLDVSDNSGEQCYSGKQAGYPGAQGGMYGAAQAQQQQQTSGEAAHAVYTSEAAHAAYPSPAPTLSPKDNALGMGPAHMQRAQSTMQSEQQQAYEQQQQQQAYDQSRSYEQQQPSVPANQSSCSPPDAYYPEGSLQVQYPDMYETGISPSGHYVPATSYSVPAYPLDDNYMGGYTATDAGYAANDAGYGVNDASSRLEFAHPPDWSTGYSPVAETAPCDLGAYVRYQ
ncbi:regulator of mushroom development [Schizophyllum commune H4-8]|uniref:Homeobox domain-containing protein n=1 Tax=Schizophyllum commune (strain H4-8 / FGSC 9210) TaxID=578458 RepID=D8QC19_SCHCM|nr:regulator of mushroom development [Schizophyllum commune H4-8]KAI5889404.1 regulator of mushroom development [Schizophyllum commune H4-8]